ncbi:hypothetical protein F5Y19DRAFT_160058 [Xylariaceae sp. FL1651]|nr:hypothetical protein F5Y19DRAFT_160058 [Xylariaceae sp. FL1651]
MLPDVHHSFYSCDYHSMLSNRKLRVGFVILASILLLLSFASGATIAYLLYRSPPDPSLQLYSPVNHLVEYVPRKFQRGRGEDKTPYQGWPSDEIDRQWEESYSAGMLSVIDAKTAGLLPENTERLPLEGREGEYIITLDVFHQMHCLDIIRMSLYRDRYDKHFYFPNGTVDHCKWLHVDHCLDQVRQALICNADVSVVYFAWSDIVQGLCPHVENKHTCRNYDKILDWAKDRTINAKEWHPSKHVVRNPDGSFSIEKGRNRALEDGGGECNAI